MTDSGVSPAWLDVSSKVNQHGATVEQRITLRQLQVKKSHCGRRSRSLQYHNVTFHRRTRRCESHIWLVDCGSFSFCTLQCLNTLCAFGLCRDCRKQVYLGEVAIRGFVLRYVRFLSFVGGFDTRRILLVPSKKNL